MIPLIALGGIFALGAFAKEMVTTSSPGQNDSKPAAQASQPSPASYLVTQVNGDPGMDRDAHLDAVRKLIV